MKKTILKSLIMSSILLTGIVSAQGKLYANSYLLVVGGDFQDGSNHSNLFFYGGIKYQAQNYYLSLSIPLVFGSSSSFMQLGNAYLPNENETGHNGSRWFNNNGHMGDNSSSMTSINAGLGDLYINGSFDLLTESSDLPALSVDSYIKFPTASQSLGIGSGKFDYFTALGIRKSIDNLSFFAQVGYLTIGKVDGVDTNNPVTISLGAGYIMDGGESSFYLAYDSYSTIVDGYSAPKQIGLGYNYKINADLFFTSILSIGLNSSVSDYSLSTGFNYGI